MSCWFHGGAAWNQSETEVEEAMASNNEKDECRVTLDGGGTRFLGGHGGRHVSGVQLSRHGARG